MRQASSSRGGMSDIGSVLVLDRNSSLPPLDARMSSENTKLLLRDAGRFVQQKGDAIFDFEFNDSDTFDVKTAGDKVHVGIGRNNPAFCLFKNPLFLVGLIRIESELAAEDPSHLAFIEHRNRMLNEFIRTRLPRQAGEGDSRKNVTHLPGYSLQNDLVELHDYLKEVFEHNFQFTGLSTLASFLHNTHSKIVYTIHTVPGAGQILLETISDHVGEFTVMLNPRKQEIATMLGGQYTTGSS